MRQSRTSALTFGARIADTGGRTRGFDYLRVGLAVAVVVWHAFPLSYGRQEVEDLALTGWIRPLIAFVLPAFFALSGFLVAGSLERNPSLLRFASLRAIRIVPALGVEVFVSALVLGPLLTTLTLQQYFGHPQFAAYFLNVAGLIHFELPGLFATNPLPGVVNGQLWTIPFELECYLALIILAAIGLARSRWLLFLAVLALQLLASGRALWPLLQGEALAPIHGVFSGRQLVLSFLWGVVLYRMRDFVPFRASLAAACGAAMTALMLTPGGDVFAVLPIAYLTAYLGLQQPPSTPIVALGDFSYGIFLYGFAIQQVVASLGPWSRHWYVNLGLTLPAVTILAALSWTLVEKPALGLRKHFGIFDPVDAWVSRQLAQVRRLLPGTPAQAAPTAD